MKTKITDFRFQYVSYGSYKVTYTSPITGKWWIVTTSDMPLIDCTKNAEEPTQTDLNILKRRCKSA